MWVVAMIGPCSPAGFVQAKPNEPTTSVTTPPRTTPTGDTGTPPPPVEDFDGPFQWVSLVATQKGPDIVLDMTFDPPLNGRRLMSGNLYWSGENYGDWIDIEAGHATYTVVLGDLCTQFVPPVEYASAKVDGSTEDAQFNQSAFLWHDGDPAPEIGPDGEEFVVWCGHGDWPALWDVWVNFPGGTFQTTNWGTLQSADGESVPLPEWHNVVELDFGTWTWEQAKINGGPRGIYWLGY